MEIYQRDNEIKIVLKTQKEAELLAPALSAIIFQLEDKNELVQQADKGV